jgi:hypothetical protein
MGAVVIVPNLVVTSRVRPFSRFSRRGHHESRIEEFGAENDCAKQVHVPPIEECTARSLPRIVSENS